MQHLILTALTTLAAAPLTLCAATTSDSISSAAATIADAPSAVHDDMDNGIVSIADDRAFSIESRNGRFSFKPYMMIQTSGAFNWYDDEGLDPAYNQDNVANTGFAVPYAIIGFTGRAYNRVNYNVSINAAGSGAGILQQAWFDVRMNDALRLRFGKQKTPFTHGYLTTLGETLMPSLPTSLTASVIMPYSLNAVMPAMATGWDLGLELHGTLGRHQQKMGYEVGIFNGTAGASNTATKTFSDDWHIPSLLYAGRITYMPWGTMPTTQGSANRLNEKKMLIGASANLNVESEYESTNDTRCGLEYALLYNRWYIGAEAYMMHVGFTKRQKIDETYNFMGGYVQAGYFATRQLQLAARYDFFNRNGVDTGGFLNSPAVGLNYFFTGVGLKLSAMYQYTGRWGHDTQLDRDNDDLGIATHSAKIQLQYCF